MNDIFDLYQEIIIDHSRAPKNFGSLADKSHHARGHNPLCGDHLSLEMKIENDTVKAISFLGDGCAISQASASLMTESLKGKSVADALMIFEDFHHLLTTDNAEPQHLGKLLVLKGVKQFPIRIKCATLCWHTFKAALTADKSASTE